MTSALKRPWIEPQERQLEQEEADVLAEDRIRDDPLPVGREGHPVHPQQDRLPRRGERAGDGHREQDRDDAEGEAGERHEVRQVLGLEDDRPLVPRIPAAIPAPRVGAGLGRVVQPADEAPQARAALGRRRAQPSGEPEVAEEDDQRDAESGDEQPDLGGDPRPEDAIEPDALEPDRVGPQVDAEGEQEEQPDDDADRDPQADVAVRAARAVIRTTGRATSAPAPAAPARNSGSGSGWPDPWASSPVSASARGSSPSVSASASPSVSPDSWWSGSLGPPSSDAFGGGVSPLACASRRRSSSRKSSNRSRIVA